MSHHFVILVRRKSHMHDTGDQWDNPGPVLTCFNTELVVLIGCQVHLEGNLLQSEMAS